MSSEKYGSFFANVNISDMIKIVLRKINNIYLEFESIFHSHNRNILIDKTLLIKNCKRYSLPYLL